MDSTARDRCLEAAGADGSQRFSRISKISRRAVADRSCRPAVRYSSVVIDVASYIGFPSNRFAVIKILCILIGPLDAEGLRYFRVYRNLQPFQVIKAGGCAVDPIDPQRF